MATAQAFRRDVDQLIRVALFGVFSGAVGFTSATLYRDSHDIFGEELVTPSLQIALENGLGEFNMRADTTIALSAIQPGEKIWKQRLWLIGQDLESDANIPHTVMGLEIVVARALLFSDEEEFYIRDEMLENQQRLTDQATWRALASLDSLVVPPAIDSVPIREDNIVSYTVALSAVLNPS